MRLILITILLFVMNGCAQMQTSNVASPRMSFLKVNQLQPGTTSQLEVESKFGSPDLKTYSSSGEEVWAFEKGRLITSFDPKTKFLISFHWSVYENDPETDVSIAQSRFPEATFVETNSPWVNPHAAPTTASLTSAEAGVTIIKRISTSKVSSIVREVPGYSRKPALSKPPTFTL